MTEIVLHDIDQVLVDRIKRVAGTRGWTVPRTLLPLLEQGLHVYEGDGSVHFDNSENDVLEAALAALQDLPDDGGFAMIGKFPGADEPESRPATPTFRRRHPDPTLPGPTPLQNRRASREER